MRQFLILISFVLLFCFPHRANNNYVFTPINATDGLSGNKVRNITQFPDGRIAVITEGLINIYDGTSFSYLHYGKENICPLSEYTGAYHEYTGADGLMWIKNHHQLMVIDIHRESFLPQPEAVLSDRWGVDTPLKDFFMDGDKSIWLVTDKDELLYLNNTQKKPVAFLENISLLSGIQDQLYDLMVSDKWLYLFFRSGLLYCYDISTTEKIYQQQFLTASEIKAYDWTSYVVQNGNYFYQLRNGLAGGIMICYDIENKKELLVLKTDYRLNYLSVDKENDIWVSCVDGLWRIKNDLSDKQFIATLKQIDGKVIHTEVSTLYHDKQGGMWLGTVNRGLLYYHADRFRFRNFGKSLFPLPEEASLNITGFSENEKGQLLIASLQGLFIYDKYKDVIEQYPQKETAALRCNSLFKDSSHRIWITTQGKGIYCLRANGNIQHYSLPCQWVYNILPASENVFYLSTAGYGFGSFNASTGEYKRIDNKEKEIFTSVYQLSFLDENTITGICDKGFFTYHLRTEEIILHPDIHRYSSLFVDNEKNIWLASQDGLHVYDYKANEKKSFYTEDGLINNYVQSIIQTADGSLWVSTANGISRLTKTEGEEWTFSFSNFNRFDGTINNEFFERSVYLSSDNELYWGGTDGFNKLSFGDIRADKQSGLPLFTAFRLFNEKVQTGETYDNNIILKEPVTVTKEIVLKHNQNFFTFEFSALNYINPTQTYYRYYLSGMDESEQEVKSTDGKGYVSYTNVLAGTYYFRVRAADNNRTWNNEYAEIKITVKAPLWKTPFAYFIYTVLVLGLLFASIATYIRRKRNKLIQQQINNSAMDVQELVSQLSEDRLSTSPDEGTNIKTLLLNIQQLLQKQKEQKEKPQSNPSNTTQPEEPTLSASDEKFIQRALQYVEQNLDNTDYSVEQLSRDLGMERTGLYRKLVAIIGKTPTTFIRSIRLKRAARLLEEGYTVSQTADSVGFGTASYLSKCFQEEFRMKPSEYIIKAKQAKGEAKNQQNQPE